ncbi:MAG: hypothetical protein ACJAWL_001209 [Motiliproteus sp.]|jgi:hypothetical protein
MLKSGHKIVISVATTLVLITTPALGQEKTNPSRILGLSAPFTLEELPAGRIRQRLERLPTRARQRALAWLHRFDFTERDLEQLQVDQDGGIFYADTHTPAPVANEPAAPAIELGAADDPFTLHSHPGAARVLFLDFDGHALSGTAWNGGLADPLYARPYDLDNTPLLFSADERNRIAEIWHRVAEDLAPFDIDVTTEAPAIFGPYTGHVLVTHSTDQNGNAMPYSYAGGVAYVGVFGQSYYSNYTPALVYYNNLGAGYAPYVAEAAAHEFGHNLGLSHDGTSTESYYTGHGSDSSLVSWAPIMGVGYYKNVTQWSNGDYPDANNSQDDMAIISGMLGYDFDDHGDSLTTSTPLLSDAGGNIIASNPETDPSNSYGDNKGVLERRNDVDIFSFSTGGGSVSLRVNPAWDAFSRTQRRGANLDLRANLYDAAGRLLASDDPGNDTGARFDLTLAAGTYYLSVAGVGNGNYSDYASLGQYFIQGTLPPESVDTTAPNPDPMSWQVLPLATGRHSLTMTATTARDDSGSAVQYYFQCATDNCAHSGWQNGTGYAPVNLLENTLYGFRIKARDSAGNETRLSTLATVTTAANRLPLAGDDSASVSAGGSVLIAVLDNDSDADGDRLSIVGLSPPGHGSASHDGAQITYRPAAGFEGADRFSYEIDDGQGGRASADVSISVIATHTNSAPVANADSATVSYRGTVVIDVLANDQDPDGDPLTITAVTQGRKGSVSITDGKITYVNTRRRNRDKFTYTISDGSRTDRATVSVFIQR